MEKYAIKNPIFMPSPLSPNYTKHIIFEGISVDEKGKQYYLWIANKDWDGVNRTRSTSNYAFATFLVW
jgi:hypothetical protein